MVCILAGVGSYSWHLSHWREFLKTSPSRQTLEEREEYLFQRHRYSRRTVISGILVFLGLLLPLSVWLAPYSLQKSVFLIYGILFLLICLIFLAIYDAIASVGRAARLRDEEMVETVRKIYSEQKKKEVSEEDSKRR